MLEVDTKVLSYLFANVELIRYYLKIASKRQKRFFLKSRIREYARQVGIKDHVDVEFYMKLFDKFLNNYICKTAKFYKQIQDFVNCPQKMGDLSRYALRMLRLNLKLSKPVMEQVIAVNRPIISSFAANMELMSDTVALETWTGGSKRSSKASNGRRAGIYLGRSSSPMIKEQRRSQPSRQFTIHEEEDEDDDQGLELRSGNRNTVFKQFKRSGVRSPSGSLNEDQQIGLRRKKDSMFATAGSKQMGRKTDFSLGNSIFDGSNPMHLSRSHTHARLKGSRSRGKFSVKLENKIVDKLLDNIGHCRERRFKSIDCGRALKNRSMMRKSVLFLNPKIAVRNSKILRGKGASGSGLRISMFQQSKSSKSVFKSVNSNTWNNKSTGQTSQAAPNLGKRRQSKTRMALRRTSKAKRNSIRASKTDHKNIYKGPSPKTSQMRKSSKWSKLRARMPKPQNRDNQSCSLKAGQRASEKLKQSEQEKDIKNRCLEKGSRQRRVNEKEFKAKAKGIAQIPRFIDWGYELRKGLNMKKRFQRMARKSSRPKVVKEPVNKKMKNKIHFYMLKKNNLMEDNFVISAREENFLLKHIVLFSIVKYNLFQRLQKISFKYTKKDVNMKGGNQDI